MHKIAVIYNKQDMKSQPKCKTDVAKVRKNECKQSAFASLMIDMNQTTISKRWLIVFLFIPHQ